LHPGGEVAVQGDAQGWGVQLVVARLGQEPVGLAVAGALVDHLPADQGAPLGVAGGVLGEVDGQGGGK
jgi:hypothetical protein